MDKARKEKNGGMSVPEFGGWDQKSGAPDYSMVFQRARQNRKQQKVDVRRPSSIGTEKELIRYEDPEDSAMKKKKFMSFISCMRP